MISLKKKLLMAGGAVDIDAAALIARMSPRPTSERARLISRTVVALKRAGVWAKLDFFYAVAAHSAQAASLNWKANSFTLLASGPNGYVTDRYYVQPNRAEGEGLSTQFRPATNGVNWTDNAAHMTAFGQADGNLMGAVGRDPGNTTAAVNSFSINGRSAGPPSGSPPGPYLQASSLQNGRGDFYYKRPGATATSFSSSGAGEPTVRHPRALYLGTNNGGDQGEGTENRFVPGGGTIMAASGGGFLTATEVNALGSAMETYLKGVGAIT